MKTADDTGEIGKLLRKRRTWRIAFGASVFFFLLFWGWIVAAILSGTTPAGFLSGSGRRSPAQNGPVIIPASFFLEPGYGITSIVPDDNLTASVNRNGGKITITFTDPMDGSFSDILTGWSVFSSGDTELDFRNFSWQDDRTFVLSLNRELAPDEYLNLTFRFRKKGGEQLRPVLLSFTQGGRHE